MTEIIKVPFINGLGKTKGCEKTPEKLVERDAFEIKINLDDPEASMKEIYQKAFDLMKKEEKAVFVGGDHSISYALTRAFFDFCESSSKEPCLIVFDAHADLMPVVDKKFPTHEEWLRQLVEDRFPCKNILIVGERSSWVSELDFLKKKQIRVLTVEEFCKNLEDACDTLMEFSFGKELYVSIDIDAIDPAFAPATGYCEPGGLSSSDFLYLIRRMNKMKNLKAIDLVEINSKKEDEGEKTLRLGEKILEGFL